MCRVWTIWNCWNNPLLHSPNIFGSRDRFHGKQFFHRWRGGDLGMIQMCYIYCALYFYYHYISSSLGHQALDPRGWGPLLYCRASKWTFVVKEIQTQQVVLKHSFPRQEHLYKFSKTLFGNKVFSLLVQCLPGPLLSCEPRFFLRTISVSHRKRDSAKHT